MIFYYYLFLCHHFGATHGILTSATYISNSPITEHIFNMLDHDMIYDICQKKWHIVGAQSSLIKKNFIEEEARRSANFAEENEQTND